MKKRVVLLIFVILSAMFGTKFVTSVTTATNGGEISVVAIQPEFYYFYVNETYYRAYMIEMMEQAIVYQPDIVVFPEYIGLPLLGLYYPWMNDYVNYTLEEVIDMTGIIPNVAYFESANLTGAAYLNTFSTLALGYWVHIVGGSICLPDGEITGEPGNYIYNKSGTADEVYNIAYFFDPSGDIIGTQKKVHLWGSEELFLKPSTEEALQVYNISIRGIRVGVGIVICYDAWFDSVGQILVQRGADVLFDVSWWSVPSLDFDPIPQLMDSIWNRSQNQVVYGVLSCLVGEVFQIPHTGRSAITAPIQLTENKDGFINIADTFNSSAVVQGVLDIPELLKLRGESVGGIYIPVNKLELLAPYIGLTILLAAAVMTVVYVKKRKRHTEINS